MVVDSFLWQKERIDRVLVAGDSLVLRETIYEEDGVTLKDLTGASVRAVFEFSTVTGGGDITKTIGFGITWVDQVNGQYDIELDAADSDGLTIADGTEAQVYYQEEITDANGKPSTPITGYISVTRDLA